MGKGRTGDHSDMVRLANEASALREQVGTLEERIQRIETELALVLEHVGVRLTIRPSKLPPGVRTSKRPPRVGPPPLPPIEGGARSKSIAPKSIAPKGRKSQTIDISEIAELVESLPPPPRAPRR